MTEGRKGEKTGMRRERRPHECRTPISVELVTKRQQRRVCNHAKPYLFRNGVARIQTANRLLGKPGEILWKENGREGEQHKTRVMTSRFFTVRNEFGPLEKTTTRARAPHNSRARLDSVYYHITRERVYRIKSRTSTYSAAKQ